MVTINMPRLGYLSADEGEFLQRLGDLMDLARNSLEIKRKVLERFTESNLYPYTSTTSRESASDSASTGRTTSPPSAWSG